MAKVASLHVLPDKHAYTDVFTSNNFKLANRHFLLLIKSQKHHAEHASDKNPVYSRLGLVISRKNVRKASQRNTIKRIVRETFRLSLNQTEAIHWLTPGHVDTKSQLTFDCVFLARPNIVQLNKKQLAGLLNTFWTKIITRNPLALCSREMPKDSQKRKTI